MWMMLIPIILFPAAIGSWLAFDQYESLSLLAARTTMRFASDDSGSESSREYGEFIKLEGMIVNPSGSDGKRFLMIDIGVESQSAAALAELQQNEIVVRDTLLKVLSSRTVEELSSVDRRSELKNDLRGALNAVLKRGTIDYLYFTQFVLQ